MVVHHVHDAEEFARAILSKREWRLPIRALRLRLLEGPDKFRVVYVVGDGEEWFFLDSACNYGTVGRRILEEMERLWESIKARARLSPHEWRISEGELPIEAYYTLYDVISEFATGRYD